MSVVWKPANTIGLRPDVSLDFDYYSYSSTYSNTNPHEIGVKYAGLRHNPMSLAWDESTRQKIIDLEWDNNRGKIYSWGTVQGDGRSNYTSCGDNYHTRWNGTAWETVSACSYSWIGNIYIRNYTASSSSSILLPKGGVYQMGSVPQQEQWSKSLITDGLQIHLDAGDTNSYSGSGNDWYDISGNDNDFTWANGTYGPSHNLYGEGIYGSTGPEVPSFWCGGRRCTGPASNSVGINNTSGYTIFLVSSVTTYSQSQSFKFYGSVGYTRGITAHHPWSDGVIYFDQGGCCATSQRLTYTASTANLEFHIWTFQRDTGGSTRRIYKDGTQVAIQTATAANINLNTTAIDLGSSNEYGGAASWWPGQINSFLVYNRGLSSTEVSQVADYLKQKIGLP